MKAKLTFLVTLMVSFTLCIVVVGMVVGVLDVVEVVNAVIVNHGVAVIVRFCHRCHLHRNCHHAYSVIIGNVEAICVCGNIAVIDSVVAFIFNSSLLLTVPSPS